MGTLMASQESLGILILQGYIQAAVCLRGKLTVRTGFTKTPDTYEDFTELLNEWCNQFSFKGKQAYLIMGDSKITQSTLKVPPMGKKDMQAFIQRKGTQEWTEKTPPISGWMPMATTSQGQQQVLLQSVPANFVEFFTRWCLSKNLQPTHAIVLTSLAADLSHHNTDDESGWKLNVFSTGSSTILLIGEVGKPPALIRELPYCWHPKDLDNTSRVTREVQRTLLFAKQQGIPEIQKVSLCGEDSEAIIEAVTGALDSHLKLDARYNKLDWLQEGIQFNTKRSDNLIPTNVLQHFTSIRYTFITFIIAMMMMFSSIATYLYMQTLLKEQHKSLIRLNLDENTANMHQIQQEFYEVEQNAHQWLSLLQERVKRSTLPVPIWFAGVASDLIPNDLMWNELRVHFQEGIWRMELSGTTPRDPLKASQLLKEYEDLLTHKAVQALIIETPWSEQWLQNIYSGLSLEDESHRKRFFMTGVIP
jgi:hypothetical protein